MRWSIVALLSAMWLRPCAVVALGPKPLAGLCHRLSATSLSSSRSSTSNPRRIGIVGGGLAGLSTAFHLLEKAPQGSVRVTLLDKANVARGGASAVAGGLVHPLSPRGKLVHWGLEGLRSTNRLVKEASLYGHDCVLRKEIYRVALSEENVQQLQQTARQLPDLCSWMDKDEMDATCGTGTDTLGGLRLTNGCMLIDVPSYLNGLWKRCQDMGGDERFATWQIVSEDDIGDHLSGFDEVVMAAGAGLWHDSLLPSNVDLPKQLVRGQSVDLKVNDTYPQEAVLGGKYVSPLLEDGFVHIGATHEFKLEPLSADQVVAELKHRTQRLVPSSLWTDSTVHRITSGWRVQSYRGALGRLPMIGKLSTSVKDVWLFTSLSSRGLLYHGIYGDILADAILRGSEENMLNMHPHLGWWKK